MPRVRSIGATAHPLDGPPRALLVGAADRWPPDLIQTFREEGCSIEVVADLTLVPALLVVPVRAVFVLAGPLSAGELLAVRRVRELAPHTAFIVFTTNPTQPDLKRAFEAGATAFLSWPASRDALRHALDSVGAQARPW